MAKSELILLALDPSPVLQLMDRALKAAGYKVVVVQDGKALDKTLEESVPALVMLGESFCNEDGIKLSIGLLERFPTLPILLYVDREKSGTAAAVLKAGLSGYLYPPLRTADVVEAVKRSLKRARRLGDWLRREVKRTTASLAEKAKISEEERAKLEAILSNIQDGVIVLDEEKKILLINQSARDIFGLGEKTLAGLSIRDAISQADLLGLLERGSATTVKYHEINLDNGRIFNAQYTPIAGIGSAITMQEISYLKEIDKIKGDFIHTLSHDLRSPLTAILGYTELVERTGPLNENQGEYLKRIQTSIQNITSLADDLLDMGRIEAGFDARRESVQVENVLRYTLDLYETQAHKKNVQIEADIARSLPPVRANPIRLRQLLDNLIGNAIKYTPAGGQVRVSIKSEEHQLILRVEDSGTGIPVGEQGRVFEKFYRGSNVPKTETGSGIGLAIVKSIVESHQGRVWVESAVGKGSTFFVVLPAHESSEGGTG